MKNRADGEKGIALLIGFVVSLTFMLGFCLGVEWKSDNSSQEPTQEEYTVDGDVYIDKETGVCYVGVKNSNGELQAMTPRYNADGTIMVEEEE